MSIKGERFSSQLTVTEVDAFQRKVYNSWVLLFYEVILREPLVVYDKIWRKLLTIEPTQLTPRFLNVEPHKSANFMDNKTKPTCVWTPSYLARAV
jgi:hypothetical protein